MRYDTLSSWTEIDWSDWDYLLEDVENRPRYSNLKSQAAQYMDLSQWRSSSDPRFLKEISSKAKKIKKHNEKQIRSNGGELLRYVRWYLAYHRRTDKYLHENN